MLEKSKFGSLSKENADPNFESHDTQSPKQFEQSSAKNNLPL